MIEMLLFSSATILVVFGLRLLFRNKVKSSLIYSLWLPAALFLLLPIPWGAWELFSCNRFTQIPVWRFTLGQLVILVWLAGAAAVGIWLVAANLSFQKLLKSSAEPFHCPQSPVPVWVSDQISAPCLYGLVHPMIYLTPECAADEEERIHVLTHELTHWRHKDPFWSFLRCLCLCVYWFHPLVWLAVQVSRQDSELACDEGALHRLGDAQRSAYGKTVVDLAASSVLKTGAQIICAPENEVPEPKAENRFAVPVLAACAVVLGLILMALALG